MSVKLVSSQNSTEVPVPVHLTHSLPPQDEKIVKMHMSIKLLVNAFKKLEL